MATMIQNPISQPLLPAVPEARGGDQDSQKLSALVRANLSNMDRVTLEHIVHRAYRMGSESCHRSLAPRVEDQPMTLEDAEGRAVARAFSAAHGDVNRAAKLLGIGRTSVYRKLRKYGLTTPHYELCPNCGCNLRLPPSH
jgi:DNA-binding NtrC family response regulator